jgi:hypothetical protein
MEPMNPSDFIKDNVKMLKHAVPQMLERCREMSKACVDSPMVEFAEMGRDLANKEALFMAMGGFNTYYEMMGLLIQIIELAEKRQREEGAS